MKAILLTDMPKNCDECILCDYSWWCVADKEERKGNDKQRPEWCPLKTIPQKKILDEELFMLGNFRLIQARFTGWNDCLDEILGGNDEEVDI